MKKTHLLIGDNSVQLSIFASHMNANSFLVTEETFPNISMDVDGCAYTSLADLTEEKIIKLALEAESIQYFSPTNGWESKELNFSTTQLLIKLTKLFNLKIKNFVTSDDPTNSLLQLAQRKTNDQQLWIAGCSYAYGFGLQCESQRYIEIVSKEMNLEYSDLTSSGSSIDWAVDQILRADIRLGDIVIWGLTGINRVDYYINNKYIPVTHALELYSKNDRKFFKKLITDDNRVNKTIKLLYQVINFLNKIGAQLIILDHSKQLSLYEHSERLKEYLWDCKFVIEPDAQIDGTHDNHPGPLTNQLWADQLINFIKTSTGKKHQW